MLHRWRRFLVGLRLPSIVTFFLFEGVTGTEELFEALRKDGFQSLFVSQSDAREFFFFLRVDTSLFCSACWTMASGMRLDLHVKSQ